MKILATIIGFFLLFQANAQNSLLWEVSGNGLESPSYLFGTMHIMPKKDFKLSQMTKAKLLEAEALLFEVNMFEMPLKEQISLARRMFLANGKTLNDLLGEEQYESLRRFAKDSLGVSQRKFDKRLSRLTPFALNSVFMAAYIGKHKMYEKELYRLGKRHKKQMGELETIDFQLDLVTNIPLDTQIDYFLNVDDMHEIYDLISMYKAQDLAGIYSLSMEEVADDDRLAGFMTLFLDDRNADWIPKIEMHMQQNSCFIAVGAAHLPGEKGVLELLKRKGYDVLPVRDTQK